MPLRYMECGPKCRSRKHAFEFNAAITKGGLREIQCYSRLCYNGAQLGDVHGRSALHVAAACGKVDVVEWLLESKHGDITQKDRESGWTALHRAMFYGQLATARLLIQFKSDINTRDHEGLGPLDIALKDRKLIIPNLTDAQIERAILYQDEYGSQQEVCTWGDNSNFTLGHSSEHGRHTPEVVDFFRKQHVDIRQIEMCKYHTVFLSRAGQVYTCGHGLGGRLAHASEETCLVPKLVDTLKTEFIQQVAASRDHTLFLAQSGTVYSCGKNDWHQLGQMPVPEKCLVPRALSCKHIKGKQVLGLGAGRFHSLLYTVDAVYTCGLNAGQLGHPKMDKERQVSKLKQVSSLNLKDLHIVSVKCSDAATVVLTKTGEIYVLHEYQCRKIASNRGNILHLYVVGGNLDHTDSQILRENGGRELVISYLNTNGKVFIWHERSPSLKRAHWLIRRPLDVQDFVLTETGIAIVTEDGEVFMCSLSNKVPPPARESTSYHGNKESIEGEFGRMSLIDLLSREEIEEMPVHRVGTLHRAVYITADKKGHNYAVKQEPPNGSLTSVPTVRDSDMVEHLSKLLEEADEYDLIHDLILQVHDHTWPVHKFIMVSRCANFPNVLVNTAVNNNEMDVPVIELTNIHPQILEQVLKYVYTDTCDLLTEGTKFSLSAEDLGDNQRGKHDDIFHMDLGEGHAGGDIISDGHKSAYQVVQEHKQGKKGKGGKHHHHHHQNKSYVNPLDLLIDVARKWGVKDLVKKIGCVSYQKGQIVKAKGKLMPTTSLHLDRNKMRDSKWELYDVQVKADDGSVFQCHKCVLVARLEYFHSMLASGWMETSSESALTLAVPGDILEILLDYLYTDDSLVVKSSQNVELLCNILVVADQMLVTRLKEMCETAVANLITLKNCGELLEFSSMYNAAQLRTTCQQFIVFNLPAVMEGRHLDVLSDDVIEELSSYYRKQVPNMKRRKITPSEEGPDKEFLEALAAEITDTGDNTPLGASLDKNKHKPKKKRNRTKSSTDDNEKPHERGRRRVSETGDNKDEHSVSRGSRRVSESVLEEKNSSKVAASGLDRQVSVRSDTSVKSDETEGRQDLKLSVDCNNKKDVQSGVGPISPWDKTTTSPTSPGPASSPWGPNAGSQVSARSGHNGISKPSESGSLRDIMSQQQNPATPAKSANKGKKFSWKDEKKKQQAHQKQQHKSLDPAAGDSTHVEVNNNSVPKPCPWGSANQNVQSFRSLMEAQEVSHPQKPRPAPGSQPVKPSTAPAKTGAGMKLAGTSAKPHTQSISWGLPANTKSLPVSTPTGQPSQQAPRKPAWGVSPGSPVSPDGSPWVGVAQSPPDQVCSFSKIVEHEQQKTEVLTKASNKPLSLIQIEEQAIQDLLQYYQASTTVDERITVERVTHEAAVPVWKRERLTSS